MSATVLGLDIGGANLKAADGYGWAVSQPFPLWREPERLAERLRALLAGAPQPAEEIAVTMTGELADCYEDKAEGVDRILAAVERIADGREITVYRTDGTFVTPADARAEPLGVAAGNWHALAKWCGWRMAPNGHALLLDIGSTTTDVINVVEGEPLVVGKSDPERLASGELIYTGVRRTPLCALVSTMPWGERRCPLAAEFFANMHDVYVLLGELPEEPDNVQTADGRPMTRRHAHRRLARMICADHTQFTLDDAGNAATEIARAQARLIVRVMHEVTARFPDPPERVVLSGSGEFLGRWVMHQSEQAPEVLSLSEVLGSAVSACAPANAVAMLAAARKVNT